MRRFTQVSRVKSAIAATGVVALASIAVLFAESLTHFLFVAGFALFVASLALRLQYRYYFDVSPGDLGAGDPWQIQSHMLEVRAYRPLTRDLSVRLSYRQYLQSKASFWCDVAVDPGCYVGARYYATDPKLGPVHTEYPEVELFWQAESLREVPVLGWLAAGTFQLSYGHYFQNTSFGNAHVLQAGYTLPY